jgi:YVTN family beta-propeller protein
VGEHPYCVAESADGRQIYVSNTQDDDISVLDARSGLTLQRIAVGEVPEGISVVHSSGEIVVTNWSSGDISVIPSLDASATDGANTAASKAISSVKSGAKSRAFGQFILQ